MFPYVVMYIQYFAIYILLLCSTSCDVHSITLWYICNILWCTCMLQHHVMYVQYPVTLTSYLFIVYCLVDSTKLFSRGYIFLESAPNIDITSKYLLYYEELKSTLDLTDLIKKFYLHLIHFDTRPLQLINSD